MAIYFLIGLWPRAIEITLKFVFEFLIACLAFEILKAKIQVVHHLGYSKTNDATTRVKFVFFKEHIRKLCNATNCWICTYLLLT